ncbi:hypothetical protein B0H17DRAFT_1199145 [Mycena rosella]|uniref:Uncharacterized protein n=1 Tax=Mycena rosella TaxID=1033263 RepID=A0AAD7DNA3_MYCRO|nr:hypothetical protein B0H17DRAFT_1199145 [Mycena rosella]
MSFIALFQMFGLTFTLATLALFTDANAAPTDTPLLCVPGGCWNSPANATDNGCQFFDGGVDAWATCGFTGAVICTTCLSCSTTACYTSPTQATGSGCKAWEDGVDATAICSFDGAIICRICS